ncbi:MAG: DUF1501 domain-containing protein [Planctomycetes bacterium]|nr:DUF1501 domain-containing protein [Planctomycetota bacterium]
MPVREQCHRRGWGRRVPLKGTNASVFTDCVFTGNEAVKGGGLYIQGGSNPRLTSCTFVNNRAEERGGGLYTQESTVTLDGCSFSAEDIPGSTAFFGGGLYASDSEVIATDCAFLDHTLTGNLDGDKAKGGGLYALQSSVTLESCTISGNAVYGGAEPLAGGGGGVYAEDTNLTLSNCTISDNVGIRYGSGIYTTGTSNVTVRDCTFTANVGGYGGAIASSGNSLRVTGCTFTQNGFGNIGGAILHLGGSFTATDCAFGYRDKEEEDAWRARDPYKTLPQKLLALGVVDEKSLAHMKRKASDSVQAAAAALTESEPGSNRLRIIPSLWPDPSAVESGIRGDLSELAGQRMMEIEEIDPARTRNMKFVEAMAAVQLRAMERDERVIILGEDVHRLNGGTVGATKGIAEKFPERLIGTPIAENANGRDHNPHGFTMWLAGGGIKPGITYGRTDDYGYYAVEDKVHFHDLHATILHLLGIDHANLNYRYAGRDFRLTDIYGEVVRDILG